MRASDHQLNTDSVKQAIDFVLRLDKLKQVRRRNPLADGSRSERTAEHSWHVAVAVMCLARYSAETIDVNTAVRLAVLHDLPETIVGDTFVYGPGEADRRSREWAGLSVLLQGLAESDAESLHESWEQYEFDQTPEGRFVKSVDVLLPIFLNFAAGPESSWQKYGVAAEAVLSRIEKVRNSAPQLAELAEQAVNDAAARGLLR